MADDKIIPNVEFNALDNPIENNPFSVSIVFINGKYYMQNDKGYTWRVLKSPKRFPGLKWTPEKLRKGDILKLGRYIYEVKVISSQSVNNDREESLDNTEIEAKRKANKVTNQLSMNKVISVVTAVDEGDKDVDNTSDRGGLPAHSSQQSKGEMLCRICLSEDSDKDNPMISPCKCAGTMKYIHLDCLKEWLNSKRSEKRGTHFSSYLWENVYCELCKDNFTENVTTQYGVVNILGIETPTNDNYIILEALNSEEILHRNTKMVHIIDFRKLKQLNVGRGHDNHVRITDISISRLHCKLICMKKEIYIDDQGSKFGSLIAEQKPVDISKLGNESMIQVGRTLLMTSVRKPKICCCKTYKTSTATLGLPYSEYSKVFPSIYKKIYDQEYPQKCIRNTDLDENGMISSQDLLQRKNFKADDVNYHTQDREQQNYDYHTLGVEIEGRPSNAMQTQTLIMPYTENNLSSGNRNNSRRNIERTPQLQSDSINDEVDHRFSSDDEEEKKNNREDKEEQKEASFNQSPTRMEKQAARMMDDPYKNIDASKNNASDASGEKEKSKIDEIHDFIDECNDELKSIDQIARSNQNEVEESKSQQARINLKSQHSNNRDPSLIIQKRERMNKTSNISKIENSSSSNLVPHQNISFSEGRRLDQMSSIPVQESPH